MQTIVGPPATGLRSAIFGVGDFFGSIFTAGSLRARVRYLEPLARSAEMYEQRLALIERDRDSALALARSPEYPGRKKVPGQITMVFPNEGRVTINVGEQQGVKPHMPVVTSLGMLGVVDTVTSGTSQVSMITAFHVRVGALVLPKGMETEASGVVPVAGLTRGDGGDRLVVEFADSVASISPGDLVVTNGFSDTVPRGIPLGRVIEVTKQIEYGSRRLVVAPAFRLGESREVYVLK